LSQNSHFSFWKNTWTQFKRQRLGLLALIVVFLFILMGIYAPFLASSKPIALQWEGKWYFPLFRYLFFKGFYTKPLDLFFNLLIFTFPLYLITLYLKQKKTLFLVATLLQFGGFFLLYFFPLKDPAVSPSLSLEKHEKVMEAFDSGDAEAIAETKSWEFRLRYMNDYRKLGTLLRYVQRKAQHERVVAHLKRDDALYTLWETEVENEKKLERLSRSNAEYYNERRAWLEEESKTISHLVMPLIRPFHWEEDAGGSQKANRELPWWELTRLSRKDFVAALIFGVRVSLVVGILAVTLQVLIGVPLGALAGYFGGKLDILLCRLLEIWESMPVFFMLLFTVAILQTKSIFLVMTVLGLFGWTSFSRYIRGEFFKQRNLAYVEACRSFGFSDRRIIFLHILPNALPPLLTLLPFAIMGAITSEAGLSFLGLGEETTPSWGVLMDEGRNAFPSESYLLWPPAILLTILLIAIALVGDALRDAIDPKLHKELD